MWLSVGAVGSAGTDLLWQLFEFPLGCQNGIITEKLSRDGSLKVTEVEVEDALESM